MLSISNELGFICKLKYNVKGFIAAKNLL